MLRAIHPYRKKPARPFSTRYLEARLDELVSQIVRLRGAGCVTCPARTNLTCSHLFSRYFRPTRFDIEPGGNCLVQCFSCNEAHNNNKKPLTDYYIRRFGKPAYEVLERRAMSNDKMSYEDLFNKWQEYQEILKEERRRIA